ncbi:MAG: hypothetical protein M1118_09285, partial [Chloroflexi bacterium]|nr:hypothetical protein [Chloroflexota bacterium]
MRFTLWCRGRRGTPEAARFRQVRELALANLAKLVAEGATEEYSRTLRPFVNLAPEVLALGPVPCSLTQRVLFGLCSLRGRSRRRFVETLREEFRTTAPT